MRRRAVPAQLRRVGNARQAGNGISAEFLDVALDGLFDLQASRLPLVGVIPPEKHGLLLRNACDRSRRLMVPERMFFFKLEGVAWLRTFAVKRDEPWGWT